MSLLVFDRDYMQKDRDANILAFDWDCMQNWGREANILAFKWDCARSCGREVNGLILDWYCIFIIKSDF